MLNKQMPFLAALCLAASPVMAVEPTLKQMIEIHNDLDDFCRGRVYNEDLTNRACATREKVSKVIKGMGYCMAYPAYTWHRC